DTITVAGPKAAGANSVPTSTASDFVVDGVAATVVGTTCPAGTPATDLCAQVTLPSLLVIPDGTAGTLVVNGVTNPAAGSYTDLLTTSEDGALVPTPSYTIESAVSSVTGPAIPSSQDGSGEAAVYTVGFTTSATGALASGSGTITLAAPAGTVFPSAASAYTVNNGSGAVAASKVALSNSNATATITTPVAIGNSTAVTVVVNGVTNPAAATGYTLAVSTSSDLAPVDTSPYNIAGAVSNLTGPAPSVSTAGSAATYTIGFTTSATGALAASSGTISLSVPSSSTIFPTAAADYTVNGTAATSVGGGGTSAVTITTPVAIGNSSTVKIVITGVTNPAGGTYNLSVHTSSDTVSVTGPSYAIGTSVTSVTGPSPTPATATVSATYTVGFTTSASGALVANSGSITLAAPSGTVFPASAGDYTVNGTAAATIAGGGTDQVTITTPVAVADSATAKVVVTSVTNPAAGSYTLSVNTSSDLVPVATPSYTITPEQPTVASVSPSVGSTAGGTSVTITGTNFVAGATVDFGTNAATNVTVVSSTSITATSPASQTGTVDVTVTVNKVTSATSAADHFTYEATYTPISPTRICDTRSGNPSGLSGAAAQCNGKTLSANTPLDVTVAGIAGVPSTGVSAVVLNITATNEATGGFVTVYPAGAAQPSTSNLNFSAGKTVANLVEVGVGTSGQVSIVSDTSTDVIVDLEGYYSVPSAPGAGLYNGLTPIRICDTRSGNPSNLSGNNAQCNGKTLSANSPLSVQVTGNGGVPSTGVTAVALNLTAVGYTTGGYITAYPAGQTAPTASNVNFAPGQGAVPNRVIVPVSSSGAIDLVSDVTTNAIVDVSGYFTAASSTATGSQFNGEATPVRIVDTRCAASPAPSFCSAESIPSANAGLTTLGAGQSMTVQVTGIAGIPGTATAVAINVTVTNTTANGFLSVNPAATPPTTSDLNWLAGETVPNLVIAKVSSAGTITIYNYTGSADVIVDVMGWYQ
ncbi:MAG: beta strand repeat-containing protein, partial [Acidimicrobiales bacterium]